MAFALPAAALLLQLLHTPSAAIAVGGVQIPIGALGKMPNVLADVIEHKPALQTITDIMPIVETVSDVFFPGSGIAEAIVFWVATHGKPWAHDDYVRAWARAQGSELGADRMLIAAGLEPDPYEETKAAR